jgi:hypothetical protein
MGGTADLIEINLKELNNLAWVRRANCKRIRNCQNFNASSSFQCMFTALVPAALFTPPLLPSRLLIAPTEPHTLRVHLICICICRSLSRRQLLRGSWSVCIITCPIQMGHLMQNTARLVIIIVRTSRSILRKVPVSVVRAGYNSIVARDRVEQRAAIGTVAVYIGAVDCWGSGLHPLDVCVDGADFGFLGGGLEPDGEVISGCASSGVCSSGKRDSIRNASFKGACLRGGA